MEIDINQKKISIGAEYKIFLNGKMKYLASKKLFRFLAEINVFGDSANTALYTIKQNWAWFSTSYDIDRYDHHTYKFRTVSFWKLHYECGVGADRYEIYGHRGRKYSVYQNEVQVAWWNKDAVAWFKGDNYRIITDDDANIELLICFCLIIDNSDSKNNDGNTVTFDLGNIGPQAKKFNPDWAPKLIAPENREA